MSKAAGNEKKNSSRLVAVLIALIVVFVLVLGGLLYYIMVIQPGSEQPREVVGGKREAEALKGSLEVMTDEEIQQALDNMVEEGMFRISIASSIIALENGPAEVRIENNLSNRYTMQVRIVLAESGEEIYSTDLIDPGYYIKSTKFDKYIAPGEYPATAIFTALYPDTGEIVGTVGANVTLHVFANATPTPSPTPVPTETPAPSATPAA